MPGWKALKPTPGWKALKPTQPHVCGWQPCLLEWRTAGTEELFAGADIWQRLLTSSV